MGQGLGSNGAPTAGTPTGRSQRQVTTAGGPTEGATRASDESKQAGDKQGSSQTEAKTAKAPEGARQQPNTSKRQAPKLSQPPEPSPLLATSDQNNPTEQGRQQHRTAPQRTQH